MLLERSKSETMVVPDDLEIRNLGKDVYEIVKNDNITSYQKDFDGEMATVYEMDKVIIRAKIKTRSEAIVAFIRARYTQDDEYAVINKGIADKQDPEYIAYRDYVSECKEYAGVYFPNAS
jgi:hypothetical protein